MKPLVFYDFKEIEGTDMIGIDKERFREILDQIYEAGFEDGKNQLFLDQNIAHTKTQGWLGGNPIITCTGKEVNEKSPNNSLDKGITYQTGETMLFSGKNYGVK